MQVPVTIRLAPEAWAEANRRTILDAIAALSRHGQTFNAVEIAKYTGLRRPNAIARALFAFEQDGLLRVETPGPIELRRYLATGPMPAAAADTGARPQQHMWNILRGPQARPRIDIPTLALLSSTDDVPVTRIMARRYVGQLVTGGFLADEGDGQFRLLSGGNTGPLAPRVMAARFLFDPNAWTTERGAAIAREAPL